MVIATEQDIARNVRGAAQILPAVSRATRPAMTPLHSHCLDLDLHRLELRFADSRLVEPRAVARLAESIERCGQIVPCVVVAAPQSQDGKGGGVQALVLIDGYRRVGALRRLGRDTVGVEQWSCDLTTALFEGVGAGAGSCVRQHRGSAAAARLGGRARAVAARSGAAERSRRELGQPAAAIAVGTARWGAGGGARRPVVELGRQPSDRPVGARQRRACRAVAGDAGGDAAVDARVAVLVRALPAGPPHRPPAHGRPPAPVHRHVAGEHGEARRRAPAGRP